MLDETSIREFLANGYPRLVGAVSLVTGSVAVAEDAVQEALVRAWERAERGESIASLDAWIAAVALNLSRSRLRHLKVERLARPRLVGASSADPADEAVIDVRLALAALPRRQREAAVLRYIVDLSTEEIAGVMRTSTGTVKSQLSKARAHLAGALALDPDPEDNHAEA